MFDFYVIKKTYRNEYLEAKNDLFVWTAIKDDGIYFDTFTDAEKFAKNYFKTFKSWKIVPVFVDTSKL